MRMRPRGRVGDGNMEIACRIIISSDFDTSSATESETGKVSSHMAKISTGDVEITCAFEAN
jgi:hypothetical protein